MANVMKFRVELRDEPRLWREFEVSDTKMLSDLCYAILASVDALGTHLMLIEYKNKKYEVVSDFEYLNMRDVSLRTLEWKCGEKAEFVYDFGSEWVFDVTLVSVSEMKRNTQRHYPYIADGAGRGIIEDMFCEEYSELLDEMDADKEIVYEYFYGEYRHMQKWRYDDFNLKIFNALFKLDVKRMAEAYDNLEA